MDLPHPSVSSSTAETISSRVVDVNLDRYHEAAIDLHQEELEVDGSVLYDDLSRFDSLFAPRPSAPLEASASSSDVPVDIHVRATRPSAFFVPSGAVSVAPIGSCVCEHGIHEDLVADVNGHVSECLNPEKERRIFTIRKIHSFVEKKYVACRGITINKTVLNVEIVSPSRVRRLIAVTGRNATKLLEWFLFNWNMYGTAFVFPGRVRLTSPDQKCFISKDPADFLQFRLGFASMEQIARYNVSEVYTLDTNLLDGNSKDLIIHSHALPTVMEWPRAQFYIFKGKFLSCSECWNGPPQMIESDDEDYDFSSPAIVKPFHPCKKYRR